MTYCVGIWTKYGLVMASDSRTNAGHDQVNIARKMHTFVQPGERVFILLNAANRDPRAYADPDRVIVGRDGPPHLAFGFGLHICLGFPLARLEGQIALPAVLARWPGIALAEERLEWLNSMVFRGMKAMPVRVQG